MNHNRLARCGLLLAALPALVGLGLSGCSASSADLDKEALSRVKTVAVVLYSVPRAIQVRDDPRGDEEEGDGSLLEALASVAQASANTGDGNRAATLAHQTFIETLNQQELTFKALTREEMMSIGRFASLAREERGRIAMALAKAREEDEKEQGAMGQAMSMLSSFGGGSAGREAPIGSAPDGLPSYGLVGDWRGAKGALLGIAEERDYLRQAAEALDVDAVLAINDPGFSWGCETCINNTGNASTQAAFLATLVSRDGTEILNMRQWFTIGGGNAAMVSGVINPLQHDGLFQGHGEKTARVFADYLNEQLAEE